jgi:hypothetical protein
MHCLRFCVPHQYWWSVISDNILLQRHLKLNIQHWITESTEQGPCWEFSSHKAGQELTVLHETKVSLPFRGAFHWSMTWATWTHSTSLSYFSRKLFNIILPSLPKKSLQLFWSKFCVATFLVYPTHVTCVAYLICRGFIIPVMFGEVYELWSSILCSFAEPPVPSPLLAINIFFCTAFSNILEIRR